jgi:riboflavin synthase
MERDPGAAGPSGRIGGAGQVPQGDHDSLFTGIVEEVGKIAEARRGASTTRLSVQAGPMANSVDVGHSVSVSGVCLTVTAKFGIRLAFDVVAETLNRTTLRMARIGDAVNLERALSVGGRVGGHFVLGHVDGVGKVASVTERGNAKVIRVSASPEIMRMMVPKGSVAVDGVSLTVADVEDESFTVWIIPHSFRNTTFRERREGEAVNIEVDILGKYVDRLMGVHIEDSGLTAAKLAAGGFGDPDPSVAP